MDKKISYLNRTFNDYKEALIEMSERYYPELHSSLRDASVGEWMVDLTADVADNLSYHIDRVYQETNIDSAHELASLYSIARNSGVKIPGPKGAMAEVKISLTLSNEDFSNDKAPIIKRGTRFSSASQSFELLTDVDFNEQFDENGASDRTVIPSVNTNGILTGYTVSKLAVVNRSNDNYPPLSFDVECCQCCGHCAYSCYSSNKPRTSLFSLNFQHILLLFFRVIQLYSYLHLRKYSKSFIKCQLRREKYL